MYLNYLPNVKNRELAEKLLKENLPGCKVSFLEQDKPHTMEQEKTPNMEQEKPFTVEQKKTPTN